MIAWKKDTLTVYSTYGSFVTVSVLCMNDHEVSSKEDLLFRLGSGPPGLVIEKVIEKPFRTGEVSDRNNGGCVCRANGRISEGCTTTFELIYYRHYIVLKLKGEWRTVLWTPLTGPVLVSYSPRSHFEVCLHGVDWRRRIWG